MSNCEGPQKCGRCAPCESTTESASTAGPDGNAPVEKPKPIPWPTRKRPTDNYNAALGFLGAVISHMSKQGTPLTTKNIDVVKHHYGNYCWNVGLRGKQKESIWRIIHAQMLEVKAFTPPGAEL